MVRISHGIMSGKSQRSDMLGDKKWLTMGRDSLHTLWSQMAEDVSSRCSA